MARTPDITSAIDRLKGIEHEYAFNADVFSEDSDKLAALKWIMENRLDIADRKIMILYAECPKGVRELATLLGVSKSTAHKEVVRIRKIILRCYDDILTASYADDHHGLRG